MQPKKPTMEQVADWIDCCLNEHHKPLSAWEQSFLESVSDQMDRVGSLSER